MFYFKSDSYEWFIAEENLTSLNSICKIQFCAYLLFKHEYIIIIQLWSWLLHKYFMKLFMDIFYTNTHFYTSDQAMVVPGLRQQHWDDVVVGGDDIDLVMMVMVMVSISAYHHLTQVIRSMLDQ